MEVEGAGGIAAGTVVTRWVGVSVAPAGHERRSDTGGSEPEVKRVLTFAASTETEDRSGDVVIASGWDLEAFRQNPVFLWAHRHDEPPIGRVLETWVDGKSLMATVEFAPTPFAQEVASLYQGGYLSGVSVGFRALELERRKASNGRTATLFLKQELLEISAAPVPLNAEALVSRAGDLTQSRGDAEGQRVGAIHESPAEAVGSAMLADLARIWQAVAEVA